MWRLVGIQGAYNGQYFELSKENVAVGSDSGCDIRLDGDPCVAGKQSALLLCNGCYVFRDLDVKCASVVNGQAVNAMVTLGNGDKIQIGDSVFRVERLSRATTVAPVKPVERVVSRQENPSTSSRPRLDQRLVWAVAAVVFLLMLATMGVVASRHAEAANAQRAHRQHLVQLANSAISSIRAIHSALTVGIAEPEYGKKVIEAQTEVDSYVAECGEDAFEGLGARMRSALQPYADAGSVWNHEVTSEYGSFLDRDSPLRDELTSRYPNLKPAERSVRYDGREDIVVYCEPARQLLWQEAGRLADGLVVPNADADAN